MSIILIVFSIFIIPLCQKKDFRSGNLLSEKTLEQKR